MNEEEIVEKIRREVEDFREDCFFNPSVSLLVSEDVWATLLRSESTLRRGGSQIKYMGFEIEPDSSFPEESILVTHDGIDNPK